MNDTPTPRTHKVTHRVPTNKPMNKPTNRTMNKTPTPRTDDLDGNLIEFCEHHIRFPKMADHARTLETELTAARRLAEKYRNLSCDSQEEADAEVLPWEREHQR